MRPNLYLLPTAAPIAQAQAPSPYLPVPPTPLLGREGKVETAKNALAHADRRLLTLLGPGGVGKTRLSLQVALELAEAFNGEVYFVQLAPITEPELVISTIAHVLDVQDHDGKLVFPLLKSRLQSGPTLLVLDNFEQVRSATAQVRRNLRPGDAARLQCDGGCAEGGRHAPNAVLMQHNWHNIERKEVLIRPSSFVR